MQRGVTNEHDSLTRNMAAYQPRVQHMTVQASETKYPMPMREATQPQ